MEAVPYLLIAAQGLTVATLWKRGLVGPYRYLILYLLGSMLRGGMLAVVPGALNNAAYRDLWLWSLPVTLVLQMLTAAEAYQRSMEEFPGASRYVHLALFSVCLLVAAVAQTGQETFTALGVVSLAQQAVATVLALTSLGIMAWAQVLKPNRRRNAIVHERVLTFHFLAISILLFLLHRGVLTGIFNAAASILCCALWIALLQPAGEQTPQGRPPEPGERVAARELGRAGRSIWSFLGQR